MPDRATLLYSDLVDSTRLGEQLGDAAMQLLWEAHDRAARDLLREADGQEIGRSDGFLLMFPGVPQALAFAVGYHAMLARLHAALQSRIGVHVGLARLRENEPEAVARGATRYELEGAALPVVARVMSAAIAGQTLLTDAARDAARQTLPPDAAAFTSHGHWRLKGVEAPIELFEHHHGGAPLAPPPDSAKAQRVVRAGSLWKPRREITHNLPAERDAFVGRGDVLHRLASRFDRGARLVSLLGTAGTGKTRTALRFGQVWLGEFPGGVSFCDLSQAHTADAVLRAVAQGLDVPLGAQDPREQLARAIAGRGEVLVILDNFEQVTAHAQATLGHWLDHAADARFLVTTRAVLGLAGEEVMKLEPLPEADSAALFVLRAESAESSFRPDAADHAAIDALVRLLDGLPLAIELAAARIRMMRPQALLERMGDRFRMLAVGGGRSDRQATLRGALDWSWDLLSPTEKSVLAQLSVFEGGFTLAAAEAVLQLPAGDAAWSLDVVQSLVEKSLVQVGKAGRLGLLQSVQVYAAGQLGVEEGSAAGIAHGDYFAGLNPKTSGADLSVDIDNLVSACRRAVLRGRGACAADALLVAWVVLRATGPFALAVELAARLRSMASLRPAERMAAEGVAGAALWLLGRPDEAAEHLGSAIDSAREAGLPTREIWWLCAIADVHLGCGRRDDASRALAQAESLAAGNEADSVMHLVFNGKGFVAVEQGEFSAARGHYEQALACATRHDEKRWIAVLSSNLGAIAFAEGRFDDAHRQLTDARDWAIRAADRRVCGDANCNLALLLQEQGRHLEARVEFETTLTLARAIGSVQLERTALCNLGLVHEEMGDLSLARYCLEGAIAMARALRDTRSEGLFSGYLGRVCARIGQIAEADASLAKGEALLRQGEDRVSLGLLLACKAHAAWLATDLIGAASALTEAEELLQRTQAGERSELGRAIAQVTALSVPS